MLTKSTIAALLLVVGTTVAQAGVNPQTDYQTALQAFREQRFAAAYGRFAKLADGGHAPAAEMARWMHEHGTLLFGSDWSASPDQQRRWNALVVGQARQRLPRDDLARAE